MAQIADIISTLDEHLQPAAFQDLGPNGLQVPGTAEITRVITGVSARRELSERAVELGAQLVLVHHGLFWDFHPTGLTPLLAERLRPLFKHDINLAAYHLPLDAHPELGNNAMLARELGCATRSRSAPTGRQDRGPRALRRRRADAGRAARARARGDRPRAAAARRRARRASARSGSSPARRADKLTEAAEHGLDAFLTGEPREHIMAEAAEHGVHFVAAGHYATETFGVKALGELLADRFGVEHVFVDLPNPV